MVFSWECSFESFARKRQKQTEAKFWQTKSQKYVLETFHHSCFSLLWKVCRVSLHPCDITHALESVQDFLIKLDMKPCMHQEEISIFSLNHVILRLAKIMNNLLEHLKILIFKVIFSVENWLNLAKKISLKNIGDQLLLIIFFENCYF